MLHNPKLLLLDEPTAGVDPEARRTFWEEIHQLSTQGITALVSTHYMDEAERCHRLAYIAYGHLLATGTTQEVINQSDLTMWIVSGPDTAALIKTLRQLPNIIQVTTFGNTLHVIGKNAKKLEEAIKPYHKKPYQWQQAPATLEDVFIHLVSQTLREH